MVLWKMESGLVLIDISAALRCKVEIRCGGSQRGVRSERPHPSGKVWMKRPVAIIGLPPKFLNKKKKKKSL